DVIPVPVPTPTLVPQATAPAASSPAPSAGTYGWANAGTSTTTGGESDAAVVPAAGLAAASCTSSNGVAPPGSGFSYGTPLGLTNAVSVANTSTQDLATVSQYLSFDAAATVSAFGSASTSASANLSVDACLGSP